jgi:hypothetical protein
LQKYYNKLEFKIEHDAVRRKYIRYNWRNSLEVRVTKEIDALILAKGGDIQSRKFNQRSYGDKMIDDASDGRLQPGGTHRRVLCNTEWD